jgi:beta-lactam-binding protein with PASTA domain
MAPYTWADSGLPAGLSFSAATGTISGTLTTAGSHTVALKVIDNVGVPVTASFVISAQTPVITPNVIGKTFPQATTTLENAGFGAPTEVFEIDCGDPSGHVIDQNPGAGASAAPGSAVSLGVAKAPGGRGGCP